MKKWYALLLVLALLLASVPAGADSLPYMRQVEQTVFPYSGPVLTTESYPEVCLSPYMLTKTYVNQDKEPLFACFPCPANTLMKTFAQQHAHFLDLTAKLRYHYEMEENASFESFLSECADKSQILADGSEGYALYLNPQNNEAYALIVVKEIAPDAGLRIELTGNMDDNLSDEERVAPLTEWAQGEVQRVMSSLTVQRMDTPWSTNRYQGVSLLSTRVPGDILTYTLPETIQIPGLPDPTVFINWVNKDSFCLCALFGDAKTMLIVTKIDTFSKVEHQRASAPDSVFTVTMPDGTSYDVYMDWSPYNNTCDTAYVSRPIGTYNEKPLYLTLEVDLYRLAWTSAEELTAHLQTILAGLELTSGNAVPMADSAAPYASATAAMETPMLTEAPAAPEQAAAPEAPAEGDGFTFRNGLHWGMTPEEVLAAEQQTAFVQEVPLSDHIVGRALSVKVSNFDVTGVYYFVDNGLAAVDFYPATAKNEDVSYLGNALKQVYGDTSLLDAAIQEKLYTVIAAARGSLDGIELPKYGWCPQDGTVIIMFHHHGTFDLIYANTTVDVNVALAVSTPTPVPYNTNGL